MADGYLGSDPENLRDAAKEFDACAAQLKDVRTTLGSRIRPQLRWVGQDSQRFQQHWHTALAPTLAAAADLLQQTSTLLRKNAQEQEKASSVYGQADFSDLRSKLQDASTDSGWEDFFLGNEHDIDQLRDALSKLTPEELNQFLTSLSDDELAALAKTAGEDGKGLFNWSGIDALERHDVLSALLANATPEEAARIVANFPWATPDDTLVTGDPANPDRKITSGPAGHDTPAGTVFGENPSWRDIHQGSYGDCGSMATLAAMSYHDSSFITDHIKDNTNGTVSVKLYDNSGAEHWVTVTKDLPVNEQGGYLGARGSSDGAGIDNPAGANWPSYYEKALAQGYSNDGNPAGTYHGIEAQWPSNLSPTVAGGDASTLKNPDSTWQAVQDGKPVVISTTVPVRGDAGRPENLPGAHAFFAKGLDGDGNIILGNPWGPPQPDAIMSKEQYEKYVTESAVIGTK
ncbi:WXG100 family type VII secretion target [Arthrobacter sp.]|uniref:WXG100 family type VII secretion target n=1 Tax=Arthrobacter sp. TaxID=1667 RepID=UPI0026E0834E|nr:WXG100 family type VII secretion target [Arthrobacter sp.]MDO5753906.1 WXG100 family type VII secretion target [Arthrobacter sp.]